uniref:Serpentine receptor class gamma n=1 Tax=Panagrellus redivivus TaxID=6233 RepID=A0A7E4VXY3_PANRE
MNYSTYSNVDAIIWLTYAIPSYSLYILELLLINCKCLGNSKFRGSFYEIFTVNLIMQLVCNLGYFINLRGGMAPMFMPFYTPGYSFWTVFLAFMFYFTMFYVMIGKMSVIYSTQRGFQINHAVKLSYWSSSRSGFIVFFATVPLALILNIYMCKQLMAQRLRRKGAVITNKSDIQLFFVTIITFLIQCGNNGIQFLFLIPNIEPFAIYMLTLQRYTTDAATLLPAWTMIMMNREMRREVINLLCGVCTKRYGYNREESRAVISRVVNPVNHDSHDSQHARPTVSAF